MSTVHRTVSRSGIVPPEVSLLHRSHDARYSGAASTRFIRPVPARLPALHPGLAGADVVQVEQVSGVSSARLSAGLGVLLRSVGWILFGLLMVVSFAALADVPSGASEDHAHPGAVVLAAGCWAACFGVSRWARAAGRVSRPFRPVVLRTAALIGVVG